MKLGVRLGWFPICIGLVVVDAPPELSCPILQYWLQCFHADQKKVVKITLQPGDVEELKKMPTDHQRRNVSFYIRKFRKIKVSSVVHYIELQ